MATNSTPDVIRIVLIDEQPILQLGLKQLILSSTKPMQVVGQSSCWAEAAALLEQITADIAIVEIEQEGRVDLEIIDTLTRTPGTQVLVLTNCRDQAVHHQAVIAGARGVLVKNTPVEYILQAIEKIHAGQLWLDRIGTSKVLEALNARNHRAPDPDQDKLDLLTQREREIIQLTLNHAEATAKHIAERLHISEHTLRNHLTSIYSKLEVAGRLELFAYAQRVGTNRFQN